MERRPHDVSIGHSVHTATGHLCRYYKQRIHGDHGSGEAME